MSLLVAPSGTLIPLFSAAFMSSALFILIEGFLLRFFLEVCFFSSLPSDFFSDACFFSVLPSGSLSGLSCLSSGLSAFVSSCFSSAGLSASAFDLHMSLTLDIVSIPMMFLNIFQLSAVLYLPILFWGTWSMHVDVSIPSNA